MSGVEDAFRKTKKATGDNAEKPEEGVRRAAPRGAEEKADSEYVGRRTSPATEYLRRQARKNKGR